MEAWIEFTDDQSLSRVAQLINKTNQFNLRTRRYSETMLRDFREKADEYALIQIRLKDKFTNYGIISSLLLRLVNKSVFIENWVMSCRVFNRNVESVAADAIISWAASKSAIRIVGGYIPTQKNSYVANLYEKLGFKPLSSGLLDGIILAIEIPYEKPVNVPPLDIILFTSTQRPEQQRSALPFTDRVMTSRALDRDQPVERSF